MSFELLMEVLGQLSLELAIDGGANTAVDVLLGHLPDVVQIGLLFSIAFLPLLRHLLSYPFGHLPISWYSFLQLLFAGLDLASQLSDYIQLLLLSFFYLLPPLCWYLSSFFYSLSYRNQETPFIFWGVSQPEKITNYIFFWQCFLDGLQY